MAVAMAQAAAWAADHAEAWLAPTGTLVGTRAGERSRGIATHRTNQGSKRASACSGTNRPAVPRLVEGSTVTREASGRNENPRSVR